MKPTGALLIIVGVLLGLYAFNMNVSVEGVNIFQRVNNMGLMEDRRNLLDIAETIALSGVVFLGFGVIAERLTGLTPKAVPAAKEERENL